MKRITALLTITAAGLLMMFASCGDTTSDEPFTGSVVLQDFTYDGTHTLYLALIDRGGSDSGSFINIEDPSSSLTSYHTTYTGPGPEDVVVATISIDNPDFDPASGLNLFLMIAEDTDDSGDLTAGDLVLPFYSLLLKNGETLELEGLSFNVGFADTQPYSTNPLVEHVWLRIDDLLPYTVDTDKRVVLRVANAADLSQGQPLTHEIVIKDRRLLGDMMLYSFNPVAHYFLLHYDTTGNGTLDLGDHVSFSQVDNVSGDYMADLATSGAELTLELNSYTVSVVP